MGLFTRGKKSHSSSFLDNDTASQLKILNKKAEEHDIEVLKHKVENLSLICRALWEFICEDKNLSENDLVKRIEK